MRDFYGFYSNGKYKVGLTGTLWVYDMEDRLIGRFKETPVSYIGAFAPGTDIFVCHSNECHLVFYDLANMRLLKKLKTSRFEADDNGGMAFSNDGKRLYCVQSHRDREVDRRLVVYDTQTFEALEEYFGEQRFLIHEIEIDGDGTCYLCAMDRNAAEGSVDRKFVGILRDGEIVERRAYREDPLTVAMYFAWRRSGFTKKAFFWTLGFVSGEDAGFWQEKGQTSGALKGLYETGHL